jgi:putative SOS response-associated peptidase YedK
MCGRYRLTRAEKIAQKFDAEFSGALRPRYNIAPTQQVPVVRATDSGRTISLMRWGLIPSWATDASSAQINARSETVIGKPAFKDSFERRRCLIPADGFYEWRRRVNTNQPFHFGLKDDSLFAFAGIWDRWAPPGGHVVESCAILTTTPNQLLRDVHDRMPTILGEQDYQAWLTASPRESHRLTDLLIPYDAELMKRYPVSSLVNQAENDVPACIVEVPEMGSAQASLF